MTSRAELPARWRSRSTRGIGTHGLRPQCWRVASEAEGEAAHRGVFRVTLRTPYRSPPSGGAALRSKGEALRLRWPRHEWQNPRGGLASCESGRREIANQHLRRPVTSIRVRHAHRNEEDASLIDLDAALRWLPPCVGTVVGGIVEGLHRPEAKFAGSVGATLVALVLGAHAFPKSLRRHARAAMEESVKLVGVAVYVWGNIVAKREAWASSQ
eukprot:scaffold5988_cov381-Prasinococcus_capsulatus_cf.AAC.12